MEKLKSHTTNPKIKEANNSLHDGLILRTMMNNSVDTIYFKDINSKFIFNSIAHANQHGETDTLDMLGKSDFDYFSEKFAQQTFDDEQHIMKTGIPIIGHVEKWVQDDGSVVWLMASKYPLYDDDGTIIGTWGTSRDVTQMKEVEEELARVNKELQKVNNYLSELSSKDALSGLYNHRHFYDVLSDKFAKEISARESKIKSSFALMLLDIDDFKTINDTYGHLVGDLFIKSIGEYLFKATKVDDSCFRYGGDEFALIIMDINLEDALKTAERIRSMIEKMTIVYNDIAMNITVSIGVGISSKADTMNELFELADSRLYESKKAGRNRVT